MLPILPKRLVVANHRVDFRKQFSGLLAEAYRLGFDPYDGDCVVFVKKDRTQLRALLGDAAGLLMVMRRFEGGALPVPWLFEDTAVTRVISCAELTLLLEGATFTVQKRVPPWRKSLPDATPPS